MRWAHHLERLGARGELARHAAARLNAGEATYRNRNLQRPATALLAEALEEAADLAGWLALLDRTHPLEGGALTLAQKATRHAQHAHTALTTLKQRLEEREQ